MARKPNSSYTVGMKVAISMPDSEFIRNEAAASKLGMSRSLFYQNAARHFRNSAPLTLANSTTDQVNHWIDRYGTPGGPQLGDISAEVWTDTEW